MLIISLFQRRTGISTLREVFTSKNVWLFQISKYYFRDALPTEFLTDHPLLQWLYTGNLLSNNNALIFTAHMHAPKVLFFLFQHWYPVCVKLSRWSIAFITK